MAVKITSFGNTIMYTEPPNDNQFSMRQSGIKFIKYADGTIYTVNNLGIYGSEDSMQRVFSITTDLAQYTMIQPNIGFECRITENLTIGINAGLVVPSPMFAINPLADGQFTNPGTVYRGYALRFYFKLFPSMRHKGYWAIQGVYKSLAFNYISFADDYGDEYQNTYTMSEHSTVTGFDLLHGNDLIGPNRHFDIDLFYGIGVHPRNRNYTITNQSANFVYLPEDYSSEPVAYNGNYSNTLNIFTPVIGFKVGFNYIKKK